MRLLMGLTILFHTINASFAEVGSKSIVVMVRGMVCAFCAQGITKKFNAIPSVESVKVDLDNKMVKITPKQGKDVADEEITKAITTSGFNVEKITREAL